MGKALVKDVMTESPSALGDDANLTQLYDLMDSKHVRHVPITDDEGRLVGIVSHRDLIKGALFGGDDMPVTAQREMLEQSKVDEIMVRDPQTIEPEDGLKLAGEMIYENKYGCLPVVDGEKLVGILTESDFVRYVVENLTE